MDKRIKYHLVLDVETTGSIEQPLVYDLGFAICDKQGRIYEERSFIISDIFENGTLMETAYYAEKIPAYKEDIKLGIRKVVTFDYALAEMVKLMDTYKVQVMCAYNLAFDRRALRNTSKVLNKTPYFLPWRYKEIEQLCIWSFACEVLYTQKTFWKVAEEQGWFTPAGNMRTSAEIGWRYMTGEYDFEENHTGLEDVMIEIGIMARCYRQNKKHDSGVLGNPWRIPNRELKEVAATLQ